MWRIITDRQGAATTGDNGRLLSATTAATMAHEVRSGMVVITSTDPNFAHTGGNWNIDALHLAHVQALVILSNPTVEYPSVVLPLKNGLIEAMKYDNIIAMPIFDNLDCRTILCCESIYTAIWLYFEAYQKCNLVCEIAYLFRDVVQVLRSELPNLNRSQLKKMTYTVEWATGISPNQQPNSEHINLVDEHGVPIPFTLPVARMLLVIPMEDEANQLAALIRCRMRQWMTDYPRARAVMERILGSFPSPPGVGRVRDRNRSRRQEVEEPEPR